MKGHTFILALVMGMMLMGVLTPALSEGARWVPAHQYDGNFRTNDPYWVEVQVFDGSLNYTGHAENPTWIYAQNFTAQVYYDESSWTVVQIFDGAGTSNTTWVNTQVFDSSVRRGVPIWTEMQVFEGVIDQEPNWTTTQEYNGQVRARTAIYQEGDKNWIAPVIMLVILWLPALIMGYFAPTYGTIIGVCLMGGVLLFMDSSFIFVFIMILINGGVMFWKGGGE